MPKINIYLPEDLATAVREAHLSVSQICQQALAEAVRAVGTAREATAALRDPGTDPQQLSQVSAPLMAQMTPRLLHALRRARNLAGQPSRVATEHLLLGIIDEPGNLGAQVLRLLDVDIPALRDAAVRACNENDQRDAAQRLGARNPHADQDGQDQYDDEEILDRLSMAGRLAVAAAVEAATDLHHNFLGCEHLLLALASQTDETAGKLLRDRNVKPDHIRRSAIAALAGIAAGYAHAANVSPATVADRLNEIDHRIRELEKRLKAGGL